MVGLEIIICILMLPFLGSSLLLCILAIGRMFYSAPKDCPSGEDAPNVAVLFAAYKNDEVILHSVQSALKWEFQAGQFKIVVLADHLQESTLQKLNQLGVVVVKMQWEESTKIKSIKHWLNQGGSAGFSHVLTMDIDNGAPKNVLEAWYAATTAQQRRAESQQLERTSESIETRVGFMDQFSENWNNRLFREGAEGWGANPALIGSGLIMPASDFKSFHETIDAVGGYDKQLEVDFILAGHRVRYLKGIQVLDEKVEFADHMQNQRKRWLAAQFFFLRKYLFKSLQLVFTRPQLFFKVCQYALVPKVILFLISGLSLSYFLFNWLWNLNLPLVQSVVLLNLGFLILTMSLSFSLRDLFRLIPHLLLIGPKLVVVYAAALLKIKGANKKFIHTPHHVKNNKDA